MAPNKKKKGFVNNKRKGRSSATTTNQPRGASRSSNDVFASLRGRLPTFHQEGNKRRKMLDVGGYYAIYKEATRAFWEWMKQISPDEPLETVSALRQGADRMHNHNMELFLGHKKPPPSFIVPPAEILRQLSESIHYRTKTRNEFYQGKEDEGHQYMIDVLQHCRTVFRFARTLAKVARREGMEIELVEQQSAEEQQAVGSRFMALALDDEEEEESVQEQEQEWDEQIHKRDFPSFEGPADIQEEISVEEVLINGDDRFQAIALLDTMDDLMSTVDAHYGLLKRFLRGQDQHHSSTPQQLILECAMVVNLATESVVVAENALASNHPHLSSFYHVLALIFMPSYIAELKGQIDPKKLESDPHMALNFVASILEASFHNRGHEACPGKVKRFVKKSGLAFATVEHQAQAIQMLTSVEIQLAMEERLNPGMIDLFQQTAGVRPHSWLSNTSFIGNDRCILYTQNLIQKIMDILTDHGKSVAKPGFWGPEFNEQTRPAARIRGDLDEPFAGRILPELVEICRRAPFYVLPEMAQLMPILDMLHKHLRGNRTDPVPISLTFGLHAMLTSILVLQGDNDISRIAACTKNSFNKLFAQLKDSCDRSKPPENAPNFYRNVGLFQNVVNFAKPVKAQVDQRVPMSELAASEKIAFWNPAIGGAYLLYATFVCSLGLGSATVDSMGQLRFALHLYHALQHEKPSWSVPLLDQLDKAFSKTKAIWVGGRPAKGSYCKHFWLAWGASLSEASRRSSEGILSYEAIHSRRPDETIRKLDDILPEEYSAAYRRLVQHDFTDTEGVEAFTVRNASKEAAEKHHSFFNLLTRINMTRDAFDNDEDFLNLNLPVVGCVLLEFTKKLSEHMGWDAQIDEVISQMPMSARSGKTVGGKAMRPGDFNASDANLEQQALAYIWANLLSQLDHGQAGDDAEKAMTFATNYFANIPKDKYTFFVDAAEEKAPLSRIPLEGPYPYGRTGKTKLDPLQGFAHFKYSKRGNPVVRLIKPGRYTPFRVGESGCAQTPYDEVGSKMTRTPNGRFRHIASYNIDELMAIGWDGAMYVSTRGRHAASGRYVPFVPGYDSDEDDVYEPFDLKRGQRSGLIDLPPDEVGLYMAFEGPEGPQLVQLKNGR